MEGDPVAQLVIGLMYFHGNGFERDDLSAAQWFERSANGGNISAHYNLAYMLANGRGQTGVALFATGLGVFFFIFLWRNLAKNWNRGAVSESGAEVPLRIPDLIVFIGASLLILQLAAQALRPFMQDRQEG